MRIIYLAIVFTIVSLMPVYGADRDFTDTDYTYGQDASSVQFWQTWADHKLQLESELSFLTAAHTTTHPAPTIRDARSQVAGSYEASLGNPGTNGYVYAKQTDGSGAWVANGSGVGDNLGSAVFGDVVDLWTTCASGYLKFDGSCDTPAGSDEIVYQADCSGVTNGFCIDTDDGDLFYYNNSALTGLYAVGADGEWGVSIKNNTSVFTPASGYNSGFSVVGNNPYAYYSSANHRLQLWDTDLDSWAAIAPSAKQDTLTNPLVLAGSYTPTGTWNWQTASVTWPTFNQSTTGQSGSGDSATSFFSTGTIEDARIASTVARGPAGLIIFIEDDCTNASSPSTGDLCFEY